MFISSHKINFILHVFSEVLQRFCKHFILGTLGIPGYAQLNWSYQLVKNFEDYLNAKNTLYH